MQGYRGGEESEIIIRLIMGKLIHHRCRCTGETFTDTQWYHWLKNHDSQESVYEYQEFRYNINDVCLNPRKPVEWSNKHCRIVITTSKSPNGWDYGYDFKFHDSYGCGGAMFVDKDFEGYTSEKAAITGCLKFMKKNLGNILKYMKEVGDGYGDDGDYEEYSTIIPYLERGMVQIDALIDRFDPRQLDLFD